MPRQLSETNSQKTFVSLLILLTLLLIYLSSACTLASYIPLTTEDRTLQAILSQFYFCATTRPSSPPIATVAPRCLLVLTCPAPKRNERFGYCELELV